MIRRNWPAFLCLLAGCANFAAVPQTPARWTDFSGLREPPPGERFYVIVFGSETTPRVPRYTHSWATFVRVTDRPGCEPDVEAHTISWMPATLDIRPWRFRIEPGSNLELHQTVKYALATGEHVDQWGPYESRPELYYRAAVQKEFLEGGGMGYQCVDTVGEAGRTGRGCDCIHGITDMDPQYTRARYRLIRFGTAASRFIAGELGRRDMLIGPDQTHDWLNGRLGLDAYPIRHRKYPGR
ncbi:MAG: hypothetical protein JWO38_4660 [Gemmataceae bacterium]|nr:hypothetical protein [Gemmataceae bacterium]